MAERRNPWDFEDATDTFDYETGSYEPVPYPEPSPADGSWPQQGPEVRVDQPPSAPGRSEVTPQAPPTPTADRASSAADINAARAIYGDRWDADAERQFYSRVGDQSLADVLTHTQEDVTARYGNQGPSQRGGEGGGGSANLGPPTISATPKSSIQSALERLFSTGGYNQDIVNRRTENARENLHRQRQSTLANQQAYLADRGLLGGGSEVESLGNLDSRIADQYGTAVSGIYADESSNADARMMQALQISAGLSAEEARLVLDRYRAENDFTLGRGQLALGNINAANSYNLGLDSNSLARDTAGNAASAEQYQALMEKIRTMSDLVKSLQQGSR